MEKLEFIEHVYLESNTLLWRLETRPLVVRTDEGASVLRTFRSREAALLHRVFCRSAIDVVQPSGRRRSPPLPQRSSVASRLRHRRSIARSSFASGDPSTYPPWGVIWPWGIGVKHATTTSTGAVGIPYSTSSLPYPGSVCDSKLPSPADTG